MQSIGVDLERVAALKKAEDEQFIARHPRSIELRERARAHMPLGVPCSWMADLWDHPPMFVTEGKGAHFTDVDGHTYLDMSLGITAASAGHAPRQVVEAVAARVAAGTAFQLPTEDAVAVSEELTRRWGLPMWQYQLSSTQAVTEAVRLARVLTGRERVLAFEGKYQGHVSELLAVEGETGPEPEYLGITPADISRTVIVAWNDLPAVEQVLANEDVALVLAEPALSNSGIIFPSPDFHAGLRTITRQTGTLLAIDETQSLPMAYGGLVREWGLEPDLVILGKSLGGGPPVAALGMNVAVGGLIDREHLPYEVSGATVDEPAVGGTLFGNALSMAAARAALETVWTPETYQHMQGLAADLAAGMTVTIGSHGLDWDVYHLGNRVGYRFSPKVPRNNAEAADFDLPPVRHLQRVFMANREVWEFGWWAGPAVSAQTTDADISTYLGIFQDFLDVLVGT